MTTAKRPKRIKPKIIYSDRYSDHLPPGYWTTWLGMAGMAFLARLPYRVTLFCGTCFGYLLYTFATSRQKTTQTNVKLCFPEMSAAESAAFTKATIIENGVGLVETCIAWFNHQRINRDMIEVTGLDIFDATIAQGRGVILVGAHYTTLDLGGVLMASVHKVGVMYRRNKNPLMDLFMRTSRSKFCEKVLPREDMRSVIRFIKKGGVMWYAPDQDYGRDNSVFAPFFGVEAATVTAIPRLVKLTGAAVLILGHHRRSDKKGYIVSISRPNGVYPTGDDRDDAALINHELEQQIRKYPTQYMWLHRRFKTRPVGEPRLYT